MTIDQLQSFLMIEKYNSFSEAAEELYLSQSSLSKKIKALEKELGVQLFERTTRNIAITHAGEIFSKYASSVVFYYQEMIHESRKYQCKFEVIRIAAISVLHSYKLYPVFDNFQKENSNIVVEIEERERDFVLEELLSGKVDMAIMRAMFVNHKNVRVIPLINDELVLLVPAGHRFAGLAEISLKETANEKYYFLNKYTGMYDYCIGECKKAGFDPKLNNIGLSKESIRSKIEDGKGISLMAEAIARNIKGENMGIIRLTNHPQLDLSLIVRDEELPQCCLQLIDYFQKNTDSPAAC